MINFFLGKGKFSISETLLLGILLSIVGGFIDVYTYLVRGKVFAFAQTGNLILLGHHFINGNWEKVLSYTFPIFAFIGGIFAAEIIKDKFFNSKIHWKQFIILIQIFILLIAAFVPHGNFDVHINILISFFCSLQAQTFKITNGFATSTTMCTANLRNGTENLFYFLKSGDKNAKEKTIVYYSLIVFFLFGAIIGSFFINFFNEKAVLIASVLLTIIFIIMFKEENN